ncbi:hypothetical protein BAUCODRAFT_507161 [Baudoinia panamericana UAMH 10762]|uniref:Transcription factor TFIIIC triple barrel domain-containing protein n=1 Tax=Baudoinia panamericana (strain UAMH 10762) TaxID=717646 RepID=M2NAI2_BAUPA|nr:uncharacterized protein BAUCODRAFT_507161 [Baudoinia panamericana UAMH 10762]EMC95860.1 hypothetical protein BAUCODRAFT_507161 [Baudoinia panamericana UAMH 10762]
MMDLNDEWEYEYDELATEDFFFTLDLTTFVPDAVPLPEISRNGKRKLIVKEPTSERQVSLGDRDDDAQNDDRSTPPKDYGMLQVLDLHSTNPIIKLNNNIYNCNWHTDLGTQFYVSKAGTITKALRPGHVADIVGISQTRLIGKPVTLRQHEDFADLDADLVPATLTALKVNAADNAGMRAEPSDLTALRPGEQLIVPPEAIKNPQIAAQASFLERLSAIKLKKGERDILPVGSVRSYVPPKNFEEIRQRALAEDRERGLDTDDKLFEQPVKRRRRRTFAELGRESTGRKPRKPKRKRSEPDPEAVYVPTAPSETATSFGLQAASATVSYTVPSFNPAPSHNYSVPAMGAAIPWHALRSPSAPNADTTSSLASLLERPETATNGNSSADHLPNGPRPTAHRPNG